MYRFKAIFYIVVCAVTVSCSDSINQTSGESRTIKARPAKENRVPGQYIVSLKEGVGTEILQEVFVDFGVKSVKDLSKGRYLITLDKDPGPEEISKRAAASSEIEHAQPNYIYRTM